MKRYRPRGDRLPVVVDECGCLKQLVCADCFWFAQAETSACRRWPFYKSAKSCSCLAWLDGSREVRFVAKLTDAELVS